VLRLATNGTVTDPLPVGDALLLLGPYPAVVGDNPAGTALDVERLS
jgi:hypothetical protein